MSRRIPLKEEGREEGRGGGRREGGGQGAPYKLLCECTLHVIINIVPPSC